MKFSGQRPRQKLSFSKKNKEWRKDNVLFGNTKSLFNSNEVRESLKNKLIYLNLYNGILDVDDMVKVLNPYQIDASYIQDDIAHNPIIVPKINLLVGEESKRRFDWYAMASNPDAISEKEEAKREYIREKLTSILQQGYEEEELNKKMEELNKDLLYTYKDIREKMISRLLKYYETHDEWHSKFLEGFLDALLYGEESYMIDVVNNEPRLTHLNPMTVRTVQMGSSNKFEDSGVIVIEDFKSPNQIIDEYHDELKPEDIEHLLNYGGTDHGGRNSYSDDHNNYHVLNNDGTFASDAHQSLHSYMQNNGRVFGSNYTDEDGNIRELKVRWMSLKKVYNVKFYDEYGEEQYRFESEEYKPEKHLGEEVTERWINEAWEGTMLGKDVFIKMRPRQLQFTSLENPNAKHLGIIGQVYNTSGAKPVSLIERAKNLQYMYDGIFDRIMKAISSNYGKIMEVDLAKVPTGWEIDKWLYFAHVNKIAFINSFNEMSSGPATGKLVGNFNNQGGKVIDLETGNYIQQHVSLLEFIKMELGELVGVTKQREGQINNRETLGGVEKSVNQSSHITELWFRIHEDVKLRVIRAYAEACKYAYKGKNLKKQFLLDQASIEILEIDGDMINEADYDILISNTNKNMELEQMLKQSSQQFVQAGGSFTTLFDVWTSSSLTEMRRKLEADETKRAEQAQQAQEMESKMQEQMMLKEEEFRNKDMALRDLLNQRDNDTRLAIADKGVDKNSDGVIDPTEQSDYDYERYRGEQMLKIKKLQDDMLKHKDTMKFNYDKLDKDSELKNKAIGVSKLKKTSKT